ncbi:hypothetical protein CJ178_31810 [Rhodococcus sp. ACPA4]|uniref:IS3 family transposase n=1 Tax=Rhodococcus sp. ACPA4 TaxID=2028571 RepID=UPI000BB126D4|nr:hypothetical protein CJ178_31810 [Rhodococcus sp. ACPA4]
MKENVRGALEADNSAYGHRRTLSVLLRREWKVSKKTVLTLMRELGAQCPVAPSQNGTTPSEGRSARQPRTC